MKFDDFHIGYRTVTDSIVVTKDDLLSYAGRYDPLFVHNDEVFAQNTIHGGLVASGLFTIARLLKEAIKVNDLYADCFGGVTMTDISWTRPVRPNDELIGEFEVTAKDRPPNSSFGILTVAFIGRNQNRKAVVSGKVQFLIANGRSLGG